MDEILEKKYEMWKNKLLDSGKRNGLINYKDTKRSSLMIKSPSYHELWNIIVEKESILEFPMLDTLLNHTEQQIINDFISFKRRGSSRKNEI